MQVSCQFVKLFCFNEGIPKTLFPQNKHVEITTLFEPLQNLFRLWDSLEKNSAMDNQILVGNTAAAAT